MYVKSCLIKPRGNIIEFPITFQIISSYRTVFFLRLILVSAAEIRRISHDVNFIVGSVRANGIPVEAAGVSANDMPRWL